MSEIVISTSQRNVLLTLENVNELSSRTQQRLSTGRRVNNSIDDAEAFFLNRRLSDEANSLLSYRDEINQAVTAVNTAIEGIGSVDNLVTQLKGVLQSARLNTNVVTRQALNTQFDGIIKQISTVIDDSVADGTNLINNTASRLVVQLNARSASRLTIKGIKLNYTTINATQVSNSLFSVAAFKAGNAGVNFTAFGFTAAGFTVLGTANTNPDALNKADTIVDAAIIRLRGHSSQFSTEVSLLQERLSFNRNIANGLQSSADKAVEADLNEEGANLVALQTRLQLGVQSLSIAGQQGNAILGLFSRLS